jgi:hypothetical protein
MRGQRFQTGWGRGEGLKRLEYGAVHVRHPVSRLRMTGATVPLPLTPSLCVTSQLHVSRFKFLVPSQSKKGKVILGTGLPLPLKNKFE